MGNAFFALMCILVVLSAWTTHGTPVRDARHRHILPSIDTITVDDLDAFFDALAASTRVQDSAASDESSTAGPDFRIVGGSYANKEVSWFASINILRPDSSAAEGRRSTGSGAGPVARASVGLCGGTLINGQYVLTAAHCVYDDTTGTFLKPATLRLGSEDGQVLPNILIQIGRKEQNFLAECLSRRRSDGLETDSASRKSRRGCVLTKPVTYRAGVKVKCHPGYNFDLNINDLCLIKLNATVTNYAPVKLNFVTPTRSAAEVSANQAPGQKAIAYGYGATQYNGQVSVRLKQATMPIVSQDICRELWAKALFGKITPYLLAMALGNKNVICADSNKADTCQGDSGGPLLNLGTGVQIGVTSIGIDCKSGVPGVYAMLSAYQDWILSVAGPAGGASK